MLEVSVVYISACKWVLILKSDSLLTCFFTNLTWNLLANLKTPELTGT